MQVYDEDTTTGQWIARDGSSIDFSGIDAREAYFHPTKKELFGKCDEPDEEEYEGYTGNTGG
jgi:hypothetical protein